MSGQPPKHGTITILPSSSCKKKEKTRSAYRKVRFLNDPTAGMPQPEVNVPEINEPSIFCRQGFG